MKMLRNALVLSALAAVVVLVPAPQARADVAINFNTFAAIAYSPSTGHYGYAYDYWSRYSAERAALARCKEPDARIIGWVKAGWLALALSDDNRTYGVGWTYGEGATNTGAKQRAFKECSRRARSVRVVLCLCSGDVAPEVFD
jgi:hypothetical protein